MDKKINLADLKQKYRDAGIDIGLESKESTLVLDGYAKGDMFDYEKYVDYQTRQNKRKLENLGPDLSHKEDFLIEFVTKNTTPKFGICHGVRRGTENNSLSKGLGVPVIGTEISDTATQFENVIQWDFHDAKEEWLDSASVVYTNSLDHAFDPIYALGNWMRCVHKKGCVYIRAFGPDCSPTSSKFSKPTLTEWEKGLSLADLHGFSVESIEKIIQYLGKQGVIDINEWTISLAPPCSAIILFRGKPSDLKYSWKDR